ncbi:MAG: hypothetical protein JWP12_2156 [Bacteroidetes bacterium]|nr:hypothetical protein [Bacteroidota bacterium]
MEGKHRSPKKMKAITDNVDELFSFAPPENLQRTVHELFFSYLISNEDVFNNDFKEIVSDVQFLIQFIKQAEKSTQK